MDIDVNPNHSIRKKVETIEFLSDIISPKEGVFLSKIEKVRNKIAHKDDFFPKLEETEVAIKEFKNFYNKINKKASHYSYSKKDLLEQIEKLSKKVGIIESFFSGITLELLESLQQNLDSAIKLIETKKEDSFIDGRKKIQMVYSKVKDLCPFRNEFMDVIKEYDDDILKSPLMVMEKYFNENDWHCPGCEYDDIHNEFYICDFYISSNDKEVISFKPLEIRNITSEAYGTIEFCEISYDGHCKYCHSCEMAYAMAPPEGSIWCESCGFCYIPGEKVGFTSDFCQ